MTPPTVDAEWLRRLAAECRAAERDSGLEIGAAWNLLGQAADALEALLPLLEERDRLQREHPDATIGLAIYRYEPHPPPWDDDDG